MKKLECSSCEEEMIQGHVYIKSWGALSKVRRVQYDSLYFQDDKKNQKFKVLDPQSWSGSAPKVPACWCKECNLVTIKIDGTPKVSTSIRGLFRKIF